MNGMNEMVWMKFDYFCGNGQSDDYANESVATLKTMCNITMTS